VSSASKVLVLGAGTLGLLGVLAARDRGAEVWISARYPHQAELARAFGASRVLSEQEATLEGLDALRSEIAFDCVLESVGGGANTLPLATAAVAPGGHISVLGLFTDPIELQPSPLFLKEVTLAWSNCYQQGHAPSDFAEAVRLIEAHTDHFAAMTTHQVALDEIERGFALAADRRSGAIKVSIVL
jgi:threonine dehydrogenase-like Zn-dependent dehydrogenase